MDVGYWGLGRVGVRCYLDFVVQAVPVCSLLDNEKRERGEGGKWYHDDYAFDVVGKCFVTAFLPVGC